MCTFMCIGAIGLRIIHMRDTLTLTIVGIDDYVLVNLVGVCGKGCFLDD